MISRPLCFPKELVKRLFICAIWCRIVEQNVILFESQNDHIPDVQYSWIYDNLKIRAREKWISQFECWLDRVCSSHDVRFFLTARECIINRTTYESNSCIIHHVCGPDLWSGRSINIAFTLHMRSAVLGRWYGPMRQGGVSARVSSSSCHRIRDAISAIHSLRRRLSHVHNDVELARPHVQKSCYVELFWN